MLRTLHLVDVGPFRELELKPAPRLNLFTGDNGLGKTFVLDVIAAVLGGRGFGPEPLPFRPVRSLDPEAAEPSKLSPSIRWDEASPPPWLKPPPQIWQAWDYDWSAQTWLGHPEQPAPIHGGALVVYARVDGTIAIRDPYQASSGILTLSPKEVWDGKYDTEADGSRRTACAGLIDDWVRWQRSAGQSFALLHQILDRLSEPDAPLRIGEPSRVRLDDRRDIPTLVTEVGEVPVTLASAGVRRVLSLAYILVWAWSEHVVGASATGKKPTRDMVLLVDEVEQHLHPRWQRHVLPALLDAAEALTGSAHVQLFASTHAPLVTASVEPVFREEDDDLVHFERDGRIVSAQEIPFVLQGGADLWLASEVFGMKHPRSKASEDAILAATAFMRGDMRGAADHLSQIGDQDPLPPAPTSEAVIRSQIDLALRRLVAVHDPFWPRWILSNEPRLQR